MGVLTRLGRSVTVAGLVAATSFGAVVATPAPAAAEPTGTAGFAEVDVDVSETAGSIRITVLRSGLAAAPGTVDYSTRDGSARGGLDFGATAGTVTFGVGEVAKTISVSLVDDRLVEQPERFEVALSNPRGAIASAGSPVIVTIQDDDARSQKAVQPRQAMQSAGAATSASATGQVAPPPRRRVVAKAQKPRRVMKPREPVTTPFEVRTPGAAGPIPTPAATSGGGGLLALLASVLLGSVAARVWMRWLLARTATA